MYDNICKVQQRKGSCNDKRCLTPERCKVMKIDHNSQIDLLKKIKIKKGIRKVFIGSGLRYDLVIEDNKNGENYLLEIVNDHVSGQMKIAPEHMSENVLKYMGKPSNEKLIKFRNKFNYNSKKSGKKQFLTYYIIAAHPGCELNDMKNLKDYLNKELKIHPEQVQIFNPTPSTYSSVMYYTGLDSFTLKPIFIEKSLKMKKIQKNVLTKK